MTYTRIEMWKPTTEDWHPSYILNEGTPTEQKLLRVALLGPMMDGCWRVCVWGNDDKGMDFDSNESTCRHVFHQLAETLYLYESDLKRMGFVAA